ncbi:BtrH N-terminal domain-containing protein [Arthrobacter glacialis]|uniref:BtrH N-terminal domain-containing protein n=1 Tax=Arthrobacter glacialis TaxID=1664 RepID=UPI000CD4198B|nr:BtrH N-terminal domain-containing protein [Arthrobacter glacialis]POH57604.1 hypothetical protein CVS28_15115 [Arthrobacter glacialis]
MLPAYDPQTEYSHWDSGLWTRVLATSGVRNPFTGGPYSEAMLAGLAGGIGFMIFTFEYKETTTASVVTRFHPGPYTENLLRRSGAGVNIQQTGSATLAQARLDAALDSGVPAVVRLVRGKLPWAASDALADMDSMDVAVVARDGDGYLVDDGGGRLERIAPEELAQARGARKADKHWQAHVVQGSGGEPTGEILTKAVLRQTIAETAHALLTQQAPPGIPPGYANNFGILGMEQWALRLRDTSTKRGWTRIFGDPQRSQAGLGMLHGLLAGKRFSGPGALRPLHAQFLREVAMLGDGASGDGLPTALGQVGAQYKELGELWDELAVLIGRDGEPDFTAMAAKVERIAGLEAAAALALQKSVD